jgi:long-chain fatty acid transport protein
MNRIVYNFLLSLFFILSQQVFSNAMQVFSPVTFNNPARMQTTQNTHLQSGAYYLNLYERYSGKVFGGPYNTIKSNHNLLFPYALFAHRLDDRFVGGMDISNPTNAYAIYPANGFQSNLGVEVSLLSYELAPKLSVKIHDRVALGVSLRYMSLWRGEINYAVSNAVMVNQIKGDTWGGSVGIWGMINPTNFVDLAYFTPMKFTARGTSFSGFLVNRNLKLPLTYSPGTLIFNYTHIFNPTYLATWQVAYSFWNANKHLVIINPVLGPQKTIFNLNWHNTFMVNMFNRVQTTERTALMVIVEYDQSLVDAFNNFVIYPIGDTYSAGIGGEYRFSDKGVLQLLGMQGRSWRPKVHNTGLSDGVALPRWTIVNLSCIIDF